MEQYDRIVLAERPKGTPSLTCFRLESAPMPALAPGQIAVRVIWLSLDPYMRGRMDDAKSYAPPVPIGGTMEAGAVGEVIASQSPDLTPGDIVVGGFGWASGAVVAGQAVRKVDPAIAPISTALGVLGMPGHTAWVGLNRIAEAKAGETIVVSAATGAVGSLAGQLAKAKGLRVIGVAGGAEKCAYATDTLGFDTCLDHRSDDLRGQIAAAAPKGVDVYFENVGGKTLEAVLPNMNTFGRIALCGMISWYSGHGLSEAQPAPVIWRNILTRRLRVQGFIIFDHMDSFPTFAAEVAPMIQDGRVHYRETIAEGLAQAPEAFLGLLTGQNFGKQLVRIGPDP